VRDTSSSGASTRGTTELISSLTNGVVFVEIGAFDKCVDEYVGRDAEQRRQKRRILHF